MGRKTTRLRIDSERLRAAIGSQETWTGYAEKFGVTKQAVCNWLSEGLIPPRALIEIARDLSLTKETIDEILIGSEDIPESTKQIVIRISIEDKP